MSSNLNDNHLLVLCKELNIKLPEEVHLLVIVSEFLLHKDEEMYTKNEIWKFRQLSDEQYYWLNQQEGDTSNRYPFLQEIERIVKLYRQVVNREMNSKKLRIKQNILRNML